MATPILVSWIWAKVVDELDDCLPRATVAAASIVVDLG